MIMARKVGFFHNGSEASFKDHYAKFLAGMNQSAAAKGVDVVAKWGADNSVRNPDQHLGDLIGQDIAVLVAAGGPPSALAAKKAAGGKVPVVFMSVADPVRLGLVESIAKPGRNMTGIAGLTSELDVARLQLLHEMLGGGAGRVGVLNNSTRPHLEEQYKVLEAEAARLHVTLVRKDAANLNEIEAAFRAFKGGQRIEALLVTADSLFNDQRETIVRLADDMLAIYQWREFTEAGGFMSFGPNIMEAYEQVGRYTAEILGGKSPADLPVVLPTRFELVINIDAAYAGGFRIPASLLSRAEFVRNKY
jgi:putative tryptophan/tyrosine transport system substrate-binding protein